MPVGGVPATLRRDRRAAPESFIRLRIVEDPVLGIDGMLGLGVPAFRCSPVLLDRGPGPAIKGGAVRWAIELMGNR